MNKFTKASIATGAGIVLLLGGAGTLAYWNDSAEVGAGSITAGTLAIDSVAAGNWYEASDLGTPIDPDTFLVVPGDSLVYIESFEVTATGDNLEASIVADASDIDTGAWGADLTASTALSIGGAAVSSIDSDNDGATVEVRVTLSFDFDSTLGADAPVNNGTQGAVVNFDDLAIVVTQQ
jgi:alternate signal-mediated exported protein